MGGIVASKNVVVSILVDDPSLYTIGAKCQFGDQLMEHFPTVLDKMQHNLEEVKHLQNLVKSSTKLTKNLSKIKYFTTECYQPEQIDVGHKLAISMEYCSQYAKLNYEFEAICNQITNLKKEIKTLLSQTQAEYKQLNTMLDSSKKDLSKAQKKEAEILNKIAQISINVTSEDETKTQQDKLQKDYLVKKLDREQCEHELENTTNKYNARIYNRLYQIEVLEKKRFDAMKVLSQEYLACLTKMSQVEEKSCSNAETILSKLNEEQEIIAFIKECDAISPNSLPPCERSLNASFRQLEEEKEEPAFEAWLHTISASVRSIINENQAFSDSEFPTNNSSIGNQTSSALVSWKRASEIFGTNFDIIKGGKALQSHVCPKESGDNWFITCIFSVAKVPRLITRLFSTSEVNASGIYELNLCVGGEFVKVVVDDYFPVVSQNDITPLYSCSKENGIIIPELWVMLLEKAFAKLSGYYNRIDSNYLHLGLQVLTGMPQTNIVFSENVLKNSSFQDSSWNTIFNASKQGYIICCHSRFECSGVLHGSTSYTLVHCREKAGHTRWVKLTNPLCEIKRIPIELDYQVFLEQFAHVNICKYDPKHSRKSLTITSQMLSLNDEVLYPVIELNVVSSNEQEEFCFGVHQMHPVFKNACANPSVLGFIVVDVTRSKEIVTFITANVEREFAPAKQLKAGQYDLVPLLFQKNGDIQNIVMSCHHTGGMNWKLVPKSNVAIGTQVLKLGQLKKLVF
ncbi:hypothetical protein C9374_009586 [Naegleria lovaniensis]|uniref:Calpain catalytic domain-containing protein n=1 Tax=Naegleria lovaniensis TaxID=51637 RepID=A0AA88KRV0_NAELO|nr:uncharacterized protein C9374_009586 [Naegleria lovaniensis]KAG2393009.1 hypothetical protein C9374_009586 [Naegleria lovaniensis]